MVVRLAESYDLQPYVSSKCLVNHPTCLSNRMITSFSTVAYRRFPDHIIKSNMDYAILPNDINCFAISSQSCTRLPLFIH